MKNSLFVIVALIIGVLVITVNPVYAGTEHCKILPQQAVDKQTFCPTCGIETIGCPVKVDLNGDGDFNDPGEGPGEGGCVCAEAACQQWCANSYCDWTLGVRVCAAVCNIPEKAPTCYGLAACLSGNETFPCYGTACGALPAGACCNPNEVSCMSRRCNLESACYYKKKCDYSYETEPCLTSSDCSPSSLACEYKIAASGNACTRCANTEKNIALNLPNYLYPKDVVAANTYSLSTACVNKTVYIKMSSCSGTTQCTFRVPSDADYPLTPNDYSSCSFIAPSTVGTYTYYACYDKTGDGDFNDPGESTADSITLISRGGGGPRILKIQTVPPTLTVDEILFQIIAFVLSVVGITVIISSIFIKFQSKFS